MQTQQISFQSFQLQSLSLQGLQHEQLLCPRSAAPRCLHLGTKLLTEKFDDQDAKKSGPKSVMSLHLYTLNPLNLPTSKDLLVDLLSSSEVVVTLRKTDAKMKWHRLIESTGT